MSFRILLQNNYNLTKFPIFLHTFLIKNYRRNKKKAVFATSVSKECSNFAFETKKMSV